MPEEGDTINVAPSRVIEIDPDGKYVLIFPVETDWRELRSAEEAINRWWQSDQPFLAIAGEITLARVNNDG